MFDYASIFIGSGLFTLTYFYFYPKQIENAIQAISWNSIKFCHYFNLFALGSDHLKSTNISIKNCAEEYETEEEEEEPYIILEGLKDNKILNLKIYEKNDFNEKYNNDFENDFDILFLQINENNKMYYKEIDQDNFNFEEFYNYELNKLDRQFLQVELCEEKEKLDIHEYISYYYINGNNLFSKYFMKYYMKKWYNKDLCDNYKINLIDKNIKLLVLNEKEKLFLKDNNYEKIEVVDEVETTYEDNDTI